MVGEARHGEARDVLGVRTVAEDRLWYGDPATELRRPEVHRIRAVVVLVGVAGAHREGNLVRPLAIVHEAREADFA